MINEIIKCAEQYKTKEVNKKYVVNSNFLKIENSDYILNNGIIINRDILIKPSLKAVMVIPKTVNNKYLIVVQPRVATKLGFSIEFPAGLVENDEEYVSAIKRELKEETGYTSNDIEIIKEYYQDTASSRATITIAKAINCNKISNQHLDADEFISFFEITLDELIELSNKGLICDGNTLYGIEILKQLN